MARKPPTKAESEHPEWDITICKLLIAFWYGVLVVVVLSFMFSDAGPFS